MASQGQFPGGQSRLHATLCRLFAYRYNLMGDKFVHVDQFDVDATTKVFRFSAPKKGMRLKLKIDTTAMWYDPFWDV